MNHFKIKKITDLKTATLETDIPESDYSLYTSDDKFIQFELVRGEDKLAPFEVKPGIFSVGKTLSGYTLLPTTFTKESILEEYLHTKHISERINNFFSRLQVYAKHKIEVPKRGMLLYGPAGTGKSQVISKVCSEYADAKETLILIWHTDKFDPSEIKDFIKSFTYIGVKQMILVAEDIGGMEMDEVRVRSDSSLLSLLDNVEKTFTIPTLILATTNHPEIFLGNLTNRRGRFDDKFEVKPPSAEFRAKFLEFFSNNTVSEETKAEIQNNKYSEFSIADIKDIIIRAEINDKTYEWAMEEIRTDIEKFKKNFQDKRSMGMGMGFSID